VERKGIVFLTEPMVSWFEQQYPGVYDRSSTRALFAIRALAQRINDAANEWLAPLGLNAGTYNYLIALYGTPGHALTQNGIRKLMHTSHASVAQIVRALERDGLVERVRNPADGRSVIVKLTRVGARTIHKALLVNQPRIELGMRDLDAQERETLMRLLAKVERGFDALPGAKQTHGDATPASRASRARAPRTTAASPARTG